MWNIIKKNLTFKAVCFCLIIKVLCIIFPPFYGLWFIINKTNYGIIFFLLLIYIFSSLFILFLYRKALAVKSITNNDILALIFIKLFFTALSIGLALVLVQESYSIVSGFITSCMFDKYIVWVSNNHPMSLNFLLNSSTSSTNSSPNTPGPNDGNSVYVNPSTSNSNEDDSGSAENQPKPENTPAKQDKGKAKALTSNEEEIKPAKLNKGKGKAVISDNPNLAEESWLDKQDQETYDFEYAKWLQDKEYEDFQNSQGSPTKSVSSDGYSIYSSDIHSDDSPHTKSKKLEVKQLEKTLKRSFGDYLDQSPVTKKNR